MSADTGSSTYTNGTLRDRFPEVVQGRAEKSSALHVPDPDADEPEPLCDRTTSNGWMVKEVAVFPPGWHEFCDYCVERLREQDDSPRTPSDPSQKVKAWRGRYGNALTSDW